MKLETVFEEMGMDSSLDQLDRPSEKESAAHTGQNGFT